MASQANIARGLDILNGYKPDGESWECSAQHDELYAQGPEPGDTEQRHLDELKKLGWAWDERTCSWCVFT